MVKAAREAAAELGRPERAPPVALEDCDQAVVEQALGSPRAGVFDREFYPDLWSKAAVLVYTLAKSQACVDGNKRLAVLLLEGFLALNGRTLRPPATELEAVVARAAESQMTQRDTIISETTRWMRESVIALEEDR